MKCSPKSQSICNDLWYVPSHTSPTTHQPRWCGGGRKRNELSHKDDLHQHQSTQHSDLILSSWLMDGRGKISRPVSTVHNNILHSYCIMDRTQPCHSCLCVTFFKDFLRLYHFPQQTGDVFVTSRSCGAPGRGKQQLILIVHDHLLPKGDLLKGVWLGGDLDKFISGRG